MSFLRLPVPRTFRSGSLWLAGALILLDQGIKAAVRLAVAPTPPDRVSGDWLTLVNVTNSGGILAPNASGYTPIATAGLGAAALVIVTCWWLAPYLGRLGAWSAGLILGAAVSTMLERWSTGRVLDMLALADGHHSLAVNAADIALALGFVLLVATFVRFCFWPLPAAATRQT